MPSSPLLPGAAGGAITTRSITMRSTGRLERFFSRTPAKLPIYLVGHANHRRLPRSSARWLHTTEAMQETVKPPSVIGIGMMFWRSKWASKVRAGRGRRRSAQSRARPRLGACRSGRKFLACSITVLDGRIRHSIGELLLPLPAVLQQFGESVQSGHAKSLPPVSDRRIGAEAPNWHGFFRLRSGQPKLSPSSSSARSCWRDVRASTSSATATGSTSHRLMPNVF
jgi:hypothetical protein